MQTPSKRHLPIVGLVGLLVLAAAGGTVYYYEFIVAHQSACSPPVHRLIFMTAIIQELGGFTVTNAAILNGTVMPAFSNSTGPSLSGVNYQNYQTGNHSITANAGDTVTIYIRAVPTSDSRQYSSARGHGFTVSPVPSNVTGRLSVVIPWNTWYTVTMVVSHGQPMSYACTEACSDMHSQMNGSVSGCG